MEDFEDYEVDEDQVIWEVGSKQKSKTAHDFPFQHLFVEHDIKTEYETCILPSLATIMPPICDLLIYNLLFSMLAYSAHIAKPLFHIVSFTLGILLILSINCPVRVCIFVSYLLSGYIVLRSAYRIYKKHSFSCAKFTIVVLVLSLLVCEFSFPYPNLWLQMRGLIMVLVMKVFSLSHDLEHGQKFPSFFEFAGYICCPANAIFGPWIPFSEYCALIKRPFRRNLRWVFRIIICVAAAIFFLTVSNCWCDYFISNKNRFLNAYRLALTFRTSHYFISYLSEMGMIVAGYNQEKPQSGKWGYRITNPFKIELPSSLMSVVVNWNYPMHMFLKRYVYRKMSRYGQFGAILATYVLSSLLHGFNIEIAVVLLSIGVFSYIQLRFQDKLSEDLDACIQIKSCQHQCHHKYKKGDGIVTLLVVLFSFLTVVHLAYLGMLMDAIDNPHSRSILNKWDEVYFCSHLILFVCVLYTWS